MLNETKVHKDGVGQVIDQVMKNVVKQSPLEVLIKRMREGDREAAAEFVLTYQARIRRRIRGKLNQPMRRLFDSEEIFSTVSRRLDLYVCQGKLKAVGEGQLWNLVFKMADHALVDKARVFRKLAEVEGSDSNFARFMLEHLKAADAKQDYGAEAEIERCISALLDITDQEIVRMWLVDYEFNEIADAINLSSTAVRKRWERIRKKLREML